MSHAADNTVLGISLHLETLLDLFRKIPDVIVMCVATAGGGPDFGRTLSATEARIAAAAAVAGAANPWAATLPSGAAAAAQQMLSSGSSWRSTASATNRVPSTYNNGSSIDTGPGSFTGTIRSTNNLHSGVQPETAGAAAGSGSGGIGSSNGSTAGIARGGAGGVAKSVYARLPSLQQLSVDVSALPPEASSAVGKSGGHQLHNVGS